MNALRPKRATSPLCLGLLLILISASACLGPRVVSTPPTKSNAGNTPSPAETVAPQIKTASPAPVSALASATSLAFPTVDLSVNIESTATVGVATVTVVATATVGVATVGVVTMATRNTYHIGLGPQMSQPCHLLYDGGILRLDPNNCSLRLTLTDRVRTTRYFGIRGTPGNFSISPDLPAYRKPGFALLACPVLQYDDNICQYTLTDESGTYRLEIRVTGVE